MTTEQSTRPARPPRPDPAFRRAALGLPANGSVTGSGAEVRVAPRRESLRDALARIPDLERDEFTPDGSVSVLAGGVSELSDEEASSQDGAGGGLRGFASRLLNGPLPDGYELEELPVDDGAAGELIEVETPPRSPDTGPDPVEEPVGNRIDDLFTAVAPVAAATSLAEAGPAVDVGGEKDDGVGGGLAEDAPDWLVLAAAEDAAIRARQMGGSHRIPMWRRVLFAVTVVALLASVPALVVSGLKLVSESTDGKFSTSVKNPTDPGYEEEVISTPTQLLFQVDATGRPVAATLMSLSGSDGGGALIYIPLTTEVRQPGYGVDRLIGAYNVLAEDPAFAREHVAGQIATLLNVGIDGVIDLDDRGWAQLVAPVAPLTIVNPDPIEVTGATFASGTIELGAEQVGPYLAAEVPGESSFNRSLRHEAVWTAWLKAVGESDRDDAVPGERSAGMGLFARGLAGGPVEFSSVPVEPDPEIDNLLRVDFTTLADIMLAAVPMPDSPAPGARPTVRLLNGVEPEPIPAEILQTVVQIGGAVTVVGNGPSFGRDETTIVYANPELRGYAELLAAGLGGGKPRHDPEAEDSVGLTVILGRDVIEGASPTTTRPRVVTSPPSAPASSGSSAEDVPDEPADETQEPGGP